MDSLKTEVPNDPSSSILTSYIPRYFSDILTNIKKVRYLGLLENVRVRRAGYAFRQSYNEFKTRYKMLSKETWPSSKHSSKSGMVWKFKASETDNEI